MKDYTPPQIETRLEKAGRFSWWLVLKIGYHTHREFAYGTRRMAQRKLDKMRYEHRHYQLRSQLED